MVQGEMDTHTAADLTATVMQELPISTSAAYDEAASVGKAVGQGTFHVANLSGLAFLNSLGKRLKVKSSELKDRPSDVAYFQFSCYLDAEQDDSSIKQPSFSTQLSLKLPQTVNDNTTGAIEGLNSVKARLSTQLRCVRF